VKIETPLMHIDKAATWQLARDLGGDKLIALVREDTVTCYLGERGDLHDWGRGCGACPACELRRRGHEKWLGSRDAEGGWTAQ
jgi:7-cyano-7-deazaguanine synthase